jgi:hypothetical protein
MAALPHSGTSNLAADKTLSTDIWEEVVHEHMFAEIQPVLPTYVWPSSCLLFVVFGYLMLK